MFHTGSKHSQRQLQSSEPYTRLCLQEAPNPGGAALQTTNTQSAVTVMPTHVPLRPRGKSQARLGQKESPRSRKSANVPSTSPGCPSMACKSWATAEYVPCWRECSGLRVSHSLEPPSRVPKVTGEVAAKPRRKPWILGVQLLNSVASGYLKNYLLPPQGKKKKKKVGICFNQSKATSHRRKST